MAEVRKKVVDDKYETSKIKVKETKKNTKKTDAKVDSKKKTEKNSNEKKSLYAKFIIFCNGVREEFKKVHWTSKKDLVKYSIACIFFIIFCSLFFFGIDKLFDLIQELFM